MRGWVCRLQLLLVLASATIFGSESRGTHDHVLLSDTRDSSNLEGQVPVFIFPRNRVTRLYPQALGSLFVGSSDSQGYGGGVRTRLHTGFPFSFDTGTAYCCVDVGTCLPSRFLATVARCRQRQQGDLISLLLFFFPKWGSGLNSNRST
jgi:hypothetical protein